MDRITLGFWGIVAILFAAAAVFAVGAETQRRSLQKASAPLETGALVRVITIVDGNTVVVANDHDERTTVSLMGARSIAGRSERDSLAVWGQAAEDAIERIARDKPARILLHSVPKDRQGRTLATLFIDDRDLALQLIAAGLAVVYPVYPFATIPMYLQEQEAARNARKGFWVHPDAGPRAQALALEWSKRKP